MNVLNLYACLGGNRYKWDEVAEEASIDIKVTAVELDPELARLYQERFPNDKVIVADAHQYLLEHYKEFDFIWSSPPCPTHSRARFWFSSNYETNLDPIYPSMVLYQEILFLMHFFKGKYCVENVIPYYEPLIPANKKGRHLYWTNYPLPNSLNERTFAGLAKRSKDNPFGENEINALSKFHNYDFRSYQGNQRLDKIARNLVDYEAGRTIFETALGIIRKKNVKQTELF